MLLLSVNQLHHSHSHSDIAAAPLRTPLACLPMISAALLQSVPEWLPSSPDETMRLDGKLPDGMSIHLFAAAREAALTMLRVGQPFTQYYRAGNGPNAALIKKNIFLRYVPPQSSADGQGRLYWGEVSRMTHCSLDCPLQAHAHSCHAVFLLASQGPDSALSVNRCLPLEKISEFYLGAQTAVLKQAFDQQIVAGGSAANADNLFVSLLSESTMLDLEAPCMRQLCYWLWGLSILMEREITETRDAAAEAAEAVLNASRERLNMSMDAAVAAMSAPDVTQEEMEALRRDMLADSAMIRRHTRKFSVAFAPPPAHSASQAPMVHGTNLLDISAIDASLNQSFGAVGNHGGRALGAHERAELLSHLAAPVSKLRGSLHSLRSGVAADLSSMGSFITSSLQTLSSRAAAAVSERSTLVSALAAEQRKRKALQNRLIEIQGNIRVFARVRPSSASELASNDAGAVDFPAENTLVLKGADGTGAGKTFEFDRVYGQDSTQEQVFADVAPFVQSAVDGFNVSFF